MRKVIFIVFLLTITLTMVFAKGDQEEAPQSAVTEDVEGGEAFESEGNTTFSFSIPLDSGDSFDQALNPGETVKVILAYGNKDDFKTKHSYRRSVEITLE